jgi:hypothetical protein
MQMMTFNEEKHLYTWNGEPIPSVSQVIKAVCGSSYDSIPADVLAKAAWRGQAVHLASELVDAEIDPWEYIDKVKTASCLQFDECIDITLPVEAYARLDRPKWDLVEHRFYCAGEFPFAGTIDRVKDGVPYEIKCTSSAKKEEWKMQLSAYAVALGSDTIGDVYHVNKNGEGKIITNLDPRFEDWFAVLRVFYMVHHKQWLKEAKEKKID